MLPKRVLSGVVLALCSLFPVATASAQAYTKIVVIGDSLSDTGNDAQVSSTSPTTSPLTIPSPQSGYTTGRFTDGMNSIPAAQNYFGVWIEQLAASLPNKPTIVYSLSPNGGNNYAYGFATTNTGTSTFTYTIQGLPGTYSFVVNNMGAQLASYLATKPTIDNKTLFVVWGGANDLVAAATSPTAAQDIVAAAQREAGIVQTLINNGATDFIVPNLPPLGLVPRFNTDPVASATATGGAQGFDQVLAQALAALPAANPTKTLHINQLDTFTLFNTIVAAPANYGFANYKVPSSAAYATSNALLNPDTYLFWDDLHPTTHGHNLIAQAALALLGTPVATTTTLTSSNAQPNLGSSVTFTATVKSTSGTPTGTVTFMDGTTTLGSSVVTGTSTTATATYTTSSLTAGTHTITATFSGVNGFTGSTSNSVSEIVTAFFTSFASSNVSVPRGGSATVALTITPYGGTSGTATFACSPVPMFFSCSVNPASITLAGDNKPVTTTVTIATTASSSLAKPEMHSGATRLVLAFALPFFGLLGFGAARKRGKRSLRSLTLSAMLLALLGAGAAGMTGCGNGSQGVRSGTYAVAVTTTANGISQEASVMVTVQ